MLTKINLCYSLRRKFSANLHTLLIHFRQDFGKYRTQIL